MWYLSGKGRGQAIYPPTFKPCVIGPRGFLGSQKKKTWMHGSMIRFMRVYTARDHDNPVHHLLSSQLGPQSKCQCLMLNIYEQRCIEREGFIDFITSSSLFP